MCELPVRKPNRLNGYDYSQMGAYFITVCTKNRQKLFGHIIHPMVGATCGCPLYPPPPNPLLPSNPLIASPFWGNGGNGDRRPQVAPTMTVGMGNGVMAAYTKLSNIGQIVKNEIAILPTKYPNVKIDKYVIMPNHVHLIIKITNIGWFTDVTVSRIIKQWKGVITKKTGFSIWQKSFHDHIIRNHVEYCRIAKYIDENPVKWIDDCFYISINKNNQKL
ncbi:MAG: hypothetical protein LBI42_01345 [Chitinispirillales bacterium]|nr:hypothetical protein [Chitinispirillales bacterium]